MWKLAEVKQYNLLQAQRLLHQMYPAEQHNIGGDCINPKCDYEFTDSDLDEMAGASGWFTCPQCQQTYNYLDDGSDSPGGMTRALSLTVGQMGEIGEQVVATLGTIPGVGQISQIYPETNFPIDAIIGKYGVEIKTNHSEAQPRFKIGGEWVVDPVTGERVPPRQGKISYCEKNGLIPAILGVRLNFYTDKADLFFREGMTDTWIGNQAMSHVATVDFSALNPFKHPHEVPPSSSLPDDDDIPW
jgi:hypothetical protein